jgi:hypothetical protein
VFVSYTWRPGVFERSSAKQYGPSEDRPLGDNFGYHAFRDKEQAEQDASWHGWFPAVIGSVAMWGEVNAAVRSIVEITGDISFRNKHWLTARKVPLHRSDRTMSDARRSADTDG